MISSQSGMLAADMVDPGRELSNGKRHLVLSYSLVLIRLTTNVPRTKKRGLGTYGAAFAALALAIAVVAGGTVGTHFELLVFLAG